MSYDLGSNEETRDGACAPGVVEGRAGEPEVDGPATGPGAGYPSVSVIITTYSRDRWDWLRECIESTQAQTVPPLEVIVVVDHNPELLDEISREYPTVTAIPNIGDRGVSGGRNSGVKASNGEVVGFVDDDAIVTPEWLETLLAHIVKPNVVGVGCYSDGLWEEPSPSWFPGEFSWTIGVSHTGLPDKPAAVRNVWTCAMLVKRSAFEVVGGFREDFGKIGNKSLPEDTDLCLRIAAEQQGGIWMWDPAKVMQHRVPAGRATFGYLMSRCYLQGWGKAAMAHMDGFGESTSSERSYAARTLPMGVGRGVADAARGDLSGLGRSGAIVAAFSVTVIGYGVYQVQNLSPKKRARSRADAS